LGLILLGLGFLVLAGAAVFVARGQKVWPTWLVATYLLHTLGELCVSPVGLSSVTKLAPRRLVGQMMGAWFLATSLGNLIAGRIAGEFKADNLAEMPMRFFANGYPAGGRSRIGDRNGAANQEDDGGREIEKVSGRRTTDGLRGTPSFRAVMA